MRDEMIVKLDAAFGKLVDAMTADLRGKPVQKTPPRPSWFGRLLCRLSGHRWTRGGLNVAGRRFTITRSVAAAPPGAT